MCTNSTAHTPAAAGLFYQHFDNLAEHMTEDPA
jgi:hypothetical protein